MIARNSSDAENINSSWQKATRLQQLQTFNVPLKLCKKWHKL
jgi:hypothetical protein